MILPNYRRLKLFVARPVSATLSTVICRKNILLLRLGLAPGPQSILPVLRRGRWGRYHTQAARVGEFSRRFVPAFELSIFGTTYYLNELGVFPYYELVYLTT